MLSRKLSKNSRARCATVLVVSGLVAGACGGSHGTATPTVTTAPGGGATTTTTPATPEVRHARFAVRRRHRQGRDRHRHHRHVDHDRLRRRRGLLGRARSRQGDVGRGQADDQVVQRPGRHQRSQGRRQVLRRAGAAGHAGHDAGLQRQGVHARRPGLRARREPGDDAHRLQALDDPRFRGRHRVRERIRHAATDPEPGRRGSGLVRLPGRQVVPRRGEEGGLRVRRLPRDDGDPRQGGRSATRRRVGPSSTATSTTTSWASPTGSRSPRT